MKVIRTIVIKGKQDWVITTLEQSVVQPGSPLQCTGGFIKETHREIAQMDGKE